MPAAGGVSAVSVVSGRDDRYFHGVKGDSGAGNVRSVIDTGCARVAVTGALRDADEPVVAARALKAMLSGK